MIYETLVQDFMIQHGLRFIVSFSGGFVEKDAELAETTLMEFFEGIHPLAHDVAILTGGTEWNLPGLATKLAKESGFKVIGVMPESGEKYKVPGLDLEIVVPSLLGKSEFGDETTIFVKASNAMVVLGGGPGAGVELYMALKMSSPERPIHVVPIFGFGGMTDLFLVSCFNKNTEGPLYSTGREAARLLLQKLSSSRTKVL